MAESTLKRLRDNETQLLLLQQEEEVVEVKRHKSSSSSSSSTTSYNQILSLLVEEDDEEPNQDLSSLITSLQQEISFKPTSAESDLVTEPSPNNSSTSTLQLSSSSSSSFKDSSEDEEENKERVIRHLLEASDDELGIPNTDDIIAENDVDGINGGGSGFEFSFCDGLWEFEDETANYYTLLQSELFL